MFFEFYRPFQKINVKQAVSDLENTKLLILYFKPTSA